MDIWRFRLFIVTFTFIMAATPALANAEEPESTETTLDLPPLQKNNTGIALLDDILNEVDLQHQTLSEQIVDFTEEIDTYFISDDQERRINYSHIQLGYRYTFYKDDPAQLDPVFQARVHLPRTQNRLTVEVSNNNPFAASNDTAAASNSGSSNPVTQSETDQAINIGLGYISEITEFFNIKLTGGTRLATDRLKLFVNLQLYRKFFFDKWSMHLSEDLYRDNIVFNRSTAQMLFERRISEDQLFRSITKNIYYFDLGYTQNHQTFYLLDRLSSRDAMIYQVGSMWEKPLDLLDYKLENYYYMVRYSRKIYRDWLFIEVAPQVHYLREEDFNPKPLISLQFTAFFGNNK